MRATIWLMASVGMFTLAIAQAIEDGSLTSDAVLLRLLCSQVSLVLSYLAKEERKK